MTSSNIKPEMNHVAVLDDIFLPFELQLTLFAATRLALQLNKVLETDYFCPDESSLDIRVNDSRRPVGGRSPFDRPRPTLVFPTCQEADQVQQTVGCPDESIACRFGDSEILKELAL